MRTRSRWMGVVAAVLVLAAARPAAARVVQGTVGVKGSAGGNLWTQPDATPAADVGFTRPRGGVGAGGGLFAEVRFIEFIAAEMDLLFEWDSLWEHQDWWWGTTTTRAETVNLRIPLLVKGVLPLGGVRLSLGIGPEFVVPLSSKGKLSTPAGVITNAGFRVRTKTSTMVTMEAGVTIALGLHLVLPIQIRAAYNATQPSNWADRVTLYRNGQVVQVPAAFDAFGLLAQNSWDFRLLVGLGYEF